MAGYPRGVQALIIPAYPPPPRHAGCEESVWGCAPTLWISYGSTPDRLISAPMSPDSIARRGRRPGDLRVVVRRPTKLPRTLGAPALFAASYGNVGSSIYYALGVTAAFALGLTPLAPILAGGIFVTTALHYAEGTSAHPHALVSTSFSRSAFHEPRR